MKPIWECWWVKVLQQLKKLPQAFRQQTHWCTSQCIPSADNSLGYCLNHCTTDFCTLLSNVKVWPLRSFFANPNTKSRVHAGCLSTSHHMAFSLSWTLWATWGEALSHSKKMPSVCLPGHLVFILINSLWSIPQFHPHMNSSRLTSFCSKKLNHCCHLVMFGWIHHLVHHL
jgi:hypothetical protein